MPGPRFVSAPIWMQRARTVDIVLGRQQVLSLPLKHRAQLGHRLLPPEVPPASQSTDFLGYPRPQFRRPQWMSLNGQWDFAIDVEAKWSREEVVWERQIRVPFSPDRVKSALS